MKENTMLEETTNTEVKPVDNNDYVPETSSGSSMFAKVVIVGAVSAIGTGVAFGLTKLKKHNEKKTIERLKKEGWKIEEPEKSEVEVVEGEVFSEDENSEEETK